MAPVDGHKGGDGLRSNRYLRASHRETISRSPTHCVFVLEDALTPVCPLCPIRNDQRIWLPPTSQHPRLANDDYLYETRTGSELFEERIGGPDQ